MKTCVTDLAAVAWLASAALWWWASRQPLPPLLGPTLDMDRDVYQPFNDAVHGAARWNR